MLTNAEELYLTLLQQRPTERDQAVYLDWLGLIKNRQAIAIDKKILSPTALPLANDYAGIGVVYRNLGEYSRAPAYYHKDHAIQEKTLPVHHSDIAQCYNNIGGVDKDKCEYSQALSYHRKALSICEKSFLLIILR